MNLFRMNACFKILLAAPVLFISCKTYQIPVESFKQQFSGIDSSKLVEVRLLGPFGEGGTYPANPIKTIRCVDKNNQEHLLPNGPSIEARFTYDANKKVIFYFDRLFVTDSTVTGIRSRFIGSMRKTIPLSSITKIEVQDGQKKYRYVQ